MRISRRIWLKWTAGLVLELLHSTTWAKTCLREKTLDQALGPFYPDPKDPVLTVREHLDLNLPLIEANDNDLTFIKGLAGKAEGQIIYLKGRCLNENCQPVRDAKILLWQASSSGRYNHRGDGAWTQFRDPRDGTLIERRHDPNFQYWGHALTDAEGTYRFKTILPGFYPADLNSGWFRPPHLHFIVEARGYARLTTQTYFGGTHILDHEWVRHLNSRDTILRSEGSSEDQDRLIVEYNLDPNILDGLVGEFDFHLRKSSGIKSFFNLD